MVREIALHGSSQVGAREAEAVIFPASRRVWRKWQAGGAPSEEQDPGREEADGGAEGLP